MKIGIISSEGGHLAEAFNFREILEGHDVFLVTYRVPHAESFSDNIVKRYYFLRMGATNIVLFFNMILNVFMIFKIFFREKPDILYSAGSEIAIPAFYIGKFFFKTRLIFIETITKVTEGSKTGRAVYSITDIFIVPWRELLRVYGKRAIFLGSII